MLGRLGINLVFVAMMGCIAVMVLPAAFGFHRYIILTGSMTGTYDRGSIVYDRPVPTSSLKVGDPITYDPPPGFTSQTRVSHRIYSIHRGVNGERIFKTKGDANAHPDIWSFTLDRPMQDKVIFHIPEVGYLFLMLSIKDFRLVLVGVPSIVIALIMLRGFWRESGEAAQQQKRAEMGWKEVFEHAGPITLAPLVGPGIEPAPARLDLHLRPARAGGSIPSPRRTVARPAPALLRVRRLVLPLAGGGAQAVGRLGRPGPAGTIRSPAAMGLRVPRLPPSNP